MNTTEEMDSFCPNLTTRIYQTIYMCSVDAGELTGLREPERQDQGDRDRLRYPS